MRKQDIIIARLQMETAATRERIEARDRKEREFDYWLEQYFIILRQGFSFWGAMVELCNMMERKGKNEEYINEVCEFIEGLV